MLLALGVWRHLYKRFPLKYNPLFWGAVFPLGMYTVCTFQMSRALGIEFLQVIPSFMVYVALLAWAAAFGGWLLALVKGTRAFKEDRR
jgi:tellurite resistance protein TehA-like permease